jgi:hypothetical protein
MGIEIASFRRPEIASFPHDYFFFEGKNGVEAAELDVQRLSTKMMEEFGGRDHPIRSAFVNYAGEPFYLKLRGAAVTRPPYFDQMYGSTKFDFKLPEDQQGHNLLELDSILENIDQYPHVKFGDMDTAFEPRKFLYGMHRPLASLLFALFDLLPGDVGGTSHYMGVKVTPGRTRVWKTIDTVTTELDSDSVRAGDDVDLLLSATMWLRRGNGEDYLPPRAGWTWKVEQIKILPRSLAANGGMARPAFEQLAL